MDVKLTKNTAGLFETTVVIPRPHKVIGGLAIPVKHLTLTFSEDQITTGQLKGLEHLPADEVEAMQKELGSRLFEAKGLMVYQPS